MTTPRASVSVPAPVLAFVPAPAPATQPRTSGPRRPVLDVVVPVHNERHGLERSVLRLYAHLRADLPYSFRITIADNASTDGTWLVAEHLAATIPLVRAVRLPEKGRGRALRAVWADSDADVLAYMDVDLSTDLAAVLPLIAPLVSGHSDLAIGTRLNRSARVVRGPKRELVSRTYNLLLRTTLATRFTDAQCGFKAIRTDRARELLPLVRDDGWFFDTELLVLAERAGLRIHEVPVDWVDDPDSRVDVVGTAWADLRGVARLGWGLTSGRLSLATVTQPARARPWPPPAGSSNLVAQLARFAAIGLASTLAYLVLYLVLRSGLSAQAANASALLLTATANTAANRRLTFGITGAGRVRHQLRGLVVFALGLALTTGSLVVLAHVAPSASRTLEVAVLVLANVVATLIRFLLFRRWVFGMGRRPVPIRQAAAS